MEILPNELQLKFDHMNPEEKAEFLKKREEALKVADAGTKVFEEGSGGAVMEKATTAEDLEERKAERQTF